MKIYEQEALVIGTGCAGYNCADRLYEYGVKDIAVVTENRTFGTSRNTGSDKQTYYKLSLAGNEGDSVYAMAKTLFSGGAVDGEIALCEAANSTAGFMRLVGLGVPFPTNKYGEYVGYKTDHDPCSRATSIGPYTSKAMTEALERSVLSKGIPLYDGYRIIRLLKDEKRIAGALAVNRAGEFVAFKAPYVILCTGGPAGIYADSVYPESQTGASSLAIDAGAEFVNLSEWQYGLASVDFRWNVSGTYQQVLPRYISIDKNGKEREFLKEYFRTPGEMLDNIFLKGYEWPFDVRKIYGSSRIDLLVYRESVLLGRKVYLDYTREPSGLEGGWDSLGKVAREYLSKSDALLPGPFARLKKMNEGAISLYREHGIHLEKEPLRIAVCAQHCNGGVRVDENWQSSVKGLYVCGEAAGTFGVFRPGGTALNSTQVGSMRAARHIACFTGREAAPNFRKALETACAEETEFIRNTAGPGGDLLKRRAEYQREMSAHFSFLRDKDAMRRALTGLKIRENNFCEENRWAEKTELIDLYINRDIVSTGRMVATSMLETARRFGSRGSAFVSERGDFMKTEPLPEHTEGRAKLILFRKKDGKIRKRERCVHPIPERELWFEKAWNAFRREIKNRKRD